MLAPTGSLCAGESRRPRSAEEGAGGLRGDGGAQSQPWSQRAQADLRAVPQPRREQALRDLPPGETAGGGEATHGRGAHLRRCRGGGLTACL